MNFKKIYDVIFEGAKGLSIGAIWQHIKVNTQYKNISYQTRKDLFFQILEKLMQDGHIKLARDGVFLSGSIDNQIQSIKHIWPPYPSDDEDDELDDIGM